MDSNLKNGKLPNVFIIFLVLISCLTISYTFLNRRPEVILENSFYILLLILFITIISFGIIFFNDRTIEFRTENFKFLFLIIIALSIIFYSVGVTLEDASNYKRLEFFHLERNWTPIIASIILVTGIAFFYFRFYLKILYGLAEVIIGVFIGASKAIENINNIKTSEYYLVILTASIYLIVRGFDNIYQGAKDPNDFITRKFRTNNF